MRLTTFVLPTLIGSAPPTHSGSAVSTGGWNATSPATAPWLGTATSRNTTRSRTAKPSVPTTATPAANPAPTVIPSHPTDAGTGFYDPTLVGTMTLAGAAGGALVGVAATQVLRAIGNVAAPGVPRRRTALDTGLPVVTAILGAVIAPGVAYEMTHDLPRRPDGA